MFGAITFLEFIEFVFIFIVSQFSSDDITLCFVIVVTTLTEWITQNAERELLTFCKNFCSM